uniref:Uncharacterized protein n=1 Tax=Kalanchoe fedtschenkoi TaxID=63787 RepID=A0A7N0T8F2_KALFE
MMPRIRIWARPKKNLVYRTLVCATSKILGSSICNGPATPGTLDKVLCSDSADIAA